jgi:hypothetical protein
MKRKKNMEIAQTIDDALFEYYSEKEMEVPQWKRNKDPQWWIDYFKGTWDRPIMEHLLGKALAIVAIPFVIATLFIGSKKGHYYDSDNYDGNGTAH